MIYTYSYNTRGSLCSIRVLAPHYTGLGEVVAQNVALELAKRIVRLLNEDELRNPS